LAEVLQVIAGVVGSAANREGSQHVLPMEAAADGNCPALTPAMLGEYPMFTDVVAEASSAAQIRYHLADVPGVSRPQVIACLKAAGLEENVANYYVGGFKTSKRVYRKDRLYAALAQTTSWMADDTMSDGEPVANDA